MIKIPDPRRGIVRYVVRYVVRSLGLAAAALFALSATPGQRAEALSLINSGAMPAAKHASEGLTTEVRGGHGGGGGHIGGGGGYHGGGGGRGFHVGGAAIHGGSFRSSGAVFHSSGFRTAHVFRNSGFHHRGFAFRHHRFHRHFIYGASYYPYYDYPYYYSHRRCHTVWTDYGPRRVCHYRHWRHHHWRHHHRRHHHYRAY